MDLEAYISLLSFKFWHLTWNFFWITCLNQTLNCMQSYNHCHKWMSCVIGTESDL